MSTYNSRSGLILYTPTPEEIDAHIAEGRRLRSLAISEALVALFRFLSKPFHRKQKSKQVDAGSALHSA